VAPGPDGRGVRSRGLLLRELRFHLGRDRQRISCYTASGRRIVLLTVFRKTKMREVQEVARAEAAMRRCIAEGHTAED
jgi:hypothetical protein